MTQFLLILVGALILFVAGQFLYISFQKKKLDKEIEKLKERQNEKDKLKDSIDLNSHSDSVNNMLDILSKRKK